MKRTFSIVALVLAAFGLPLESLTAQAPLKTKAFQNFRATGYGEAIGELPANGASDHFQSGYGDSLGDISPASPSSPLPPEQQAYGRQAYGRQAYGRQAYGRQAYGRQAYGRQASGRQASGQQAAVSPQRDSVASAANSRRLRAAGPMGTILSGWNRQTENAEKAVSPSDAGCDSGCDLRGCDGGCDGDCGLGGCGCGRWFGSFEYMHIYVEGRSLPSLVTTSVNPLDEGVMGRASTRVLFGNEKIGDERQAGGRLTIGKWLDGSERVGIGVRYFGMEGDSTGFSAASGGGGVIARPFFNIDPIVVAEDSFLVSAPGVSAGSIDVLTSSDMLNAEAYVRYMVRKSCNFRLDFIGGYHFNRLDDGLHISHQSTSLPPNGPAPIGSTFDIQDVFDATNEFHGLQLGLLGEWQRGCVTLSVLGKVSVGNMHQELSVSGSSMIGDGAGGMVNYNGGLLAQPFDNIGRYENDEAGFIPELGIDLRYAVTKRLDISVGYTFMHWNAVALAGDQIDRVVNGSQLSGGNLVGPARPTLAGIQDSSFWLQSINIGVSGTY